MNWTRFRVSLIFHAVFASAVLLVCEVASAAVWRWGCIGAMGDAQFVFNRYKLVLLSGHEPGGKLDEIIFTDDFVTPNLATRVLAAYEPNDVNGGLEKSMIYSEVKAGGKLTLTELSSTRTGRKSSLVGSCRDESTERFRKTYRIERDNEAPRTITLACIEYQLSTRGGRICR